MKRFCVAVRECFMSKYLIIPICVDILRQMNINKDKNWLDMFASLDYMHWRWKKHPTCWARQCVNKSNHKSIVLKAVVDQSLWIWHAYSSVSKSNNNLNMLDKSPLIELQGEWVFLQ